jgi:hypothetical protein
LKTEEPQAAYRVGDAAGATELPYDTDTAKDAVKVKLKTKHGLSSAG